MGAEDSQPTMDDPREWGRAKEMSALEALMWRAEVDPVLRSYVLAIEILDCVPDWDRLLAAHDWATRAVRRFRERVVEPPFNLGAPAWAADGDFDLGYHVRRVSLPAPGTMRQLLDYVQVMAVAPLDSTRPPWEAVLVEGLEGGRGAYVLKLNHALTDGLGAIKLLEMIHSRQREPTPDKLQVAPPRPEQPTPGGLLAGQLRRRLAEAPHDAAQAALAALSLAACGLGHPDRALADAVDYGQSLRRVLAPPAAAGSPLLRGRSRSWHFDAHDVPLTDLRAAAKAAGGSVNDAYLAALLAAFRRYHEHFGVEVETMPIAIPISVRRQGDSMGGNRIAGARIAAPWASPTRACGSSACKRS